LSNTNDNICRPEPGASFFPGRTVSADSANRLATNHNFLITRSGHTLVNQAGNGELIKNDATWRTFGAYVVRLHPRGGDVTIALTNTTGTAGYEFRFTLEGSAGTVTSSTANAGNSFITTYSSTLADTYYDEWLACTLEVRRTSGSGDVTIGRLRIYQAEITNNPYTTQGRLVGLDAAGAADDALDVYTVRHALDTTSTLYNAAYKHIVNNSIWSTHALESPDTAAIASSGKSGVATRARLVGGLHMGKTGRRTYRIFATGRVSASTATLTMSTSGYADTAFTFTISGTGTAPTGYELWPAWNEVWQWAPRDLAAWSLIADVDATEYLYLQSLTIIEDPDTL
jgi:hypothetical protein